MARIAEEHLSDKAAIAVQNILGSESLVEASTWADWIRSDPDWSHAGPWHYINIPDGASYGESEKNPKGDAYTKLVESIGILRDEGADALEKARAIRWVAHLVGDLHQPLHVGRARDRGGNDVEGEWFGKSTNAHRIWDAELIESTGYSFSEYAESIDRRVAVDVESGPEPRIMDWIEESAQYRERAYRLPEPGYGGTYRYIFENLDLVELRLKQAGLRLALTLNYAMGGAEEWAGMPLHLHWVRNSAEYEALARQIYAGARERLDAMIESGQIDASKPWGVALDADETVFDNSLYAKELAGAPFDPVSWDEWCRRQKAGAVPGSVEFISHVKDLGGKVAIVSNRSVHVQEETEANLRAGGIARAPSVGGR